MTTTPAEPPVAPPRDDPAGPVATPPSPVKTPALRHLEAELADLERRGLLRLPPERRPRDPDGPPLLVLCSNDYLGYAQSPWPSDTGISGSGASRLVSGEHTAHADAEQAIAAWLGTESSLLFSSGYAANVGAISALAKPGDVIISDALNHASIIDGCRLSGAKIVVVPHKDTAAVESALIEARALPARAPTPAHHTDPARAPAPAHHTDPARNTTPAHHTDPAHNTDPARNTTPAHHTDPARNTTPARNTAPAHHTDHAPGRIWVVTESYFSMDGDIPDLATLRALCDRYDAALYVDEAHALGVFGPQGRGLCADAGILPDVLAGTLGKALGLQGAFIAGSRVLRTYLWNRARSFVFSTGVSPALAAHARAHVERAARDTGSRLRLHENARRLREGLQNLGIALLPDSRGPILPWLIGSPEAALAASRALREHGILAQPIRPPTVPAGTSRLRITVTAALTEADLDRALIAFHHLHRT